MSVATETVASDAPESVARVDSVQSTIKQVHVRSGIYTFCASIIELPVNIYLSPYKYTVLADHQIVHTGSMPRLPHHRMIYSPELQLYSDVPVVVSLYTTATSLKPIFQLSGLASDDGGPLVFQPLA